MQLLQGIDRGVAALHGGNALSGSLPGGTVILANNTNNGFGVGPSYLEGYFTTAVHEVGHALGLQHTWTGSAMSQDVLRNTSRARPFDYDDVAAINEFLTWTVDPIGQILSASIAIVTLARIDPIITLFAVLPLGFILLFVGFTAGVAGLFLGIIGTASYYSLKRKK